MSAGAVSARSRSLPAPRRCGRRGRRAAASGRHVAVVQRGRRARARAHVEQRLLGRVRALDRRHEAERVEPGRLRQPLDRRRLGERLRARARRRSRARGRRCACAGASRRQRHAGRQRQSTADCRSGRVYWCASHEPQFRQVHVPEGRPCLAAPARRRARGAQARVRRGLRELRRRPLPARILAGRHARRRRPDAVDREPRASRTSTSSTSCSARAG